MAEDSLLTGRLEPTNEPYAIAKIAGIKLCESYNRQFGCDFRSLMPTNLYGPGDNYHPTYSHVIPALLRKFHEAKLKSEKKVSVWGSGSARREFLHVDDLADAAVFVMDLPASQLDTVTEPMCSHINVGSGCEISIRDLAALIAEVTDYSHEIEFDSSKPDGAPRKLLDTTKLDTLGWQARIDLRDGLQSVYSEIFKKGFFNSSI